MSRRRIEQGVNAGSTFSLRDITDTPADPQMHFIRKAPVAAPPSLPAQPQSGLSFKFNQPLSVARAPIHGGGVQAPAAPAKVSVPPPMMPVLANPFAAPAPSVGIQRASGGGGGQEVMRLSAASDELRNRLKASTDKCGQLEQQLARTSNMVARERQEAQQQVAAVRQELASVRESELRLRTELAQRPTVTEFKQDKFNNAVRTAMEVEETNARVADAEAKIKTLTKRSDALNAEVKLLEETRQSHLDAAAFNTKAMFTEEQIAQKLKSLAEAEVKIRASEERLAVLADDISKHSAMRDATRTESEKLSIEKITANEALVKAVGDLTATRQEQGETALKLAALKDELAEVQAELTTAKEAPIKVEGGNAAPAASSGNMQPAITVTGAMPPSTNLGFPKDSTTRRIDAMGCSGCGVPYLVAIDAPISIGSHEGAEGSTPIDEMVKAIVADLKGYFAFAAEENAKRGLARGSATGGEAVPAANAIAVM